MLHKIHLLLTFGSSARPRTFCEKTQRFCASPTVQTSLDKQFHCDLRSLNCKLQYNCIDHHGNQQHGCSHSTAICKPEFNFVVEDASERKTNKSRTHRTNKVPHIDAGSHFMQENTGCVRFLPSKHQLYAAIPLSSLLYYLHISTLSLLSSHLYSLHISTLFTSLLSAHLCSLHASTLFTFLFSARL